MTRSAELQIIDDYFPLRFASFSISFLSPFDSATVRWFLLLDKQRFRARKKKYGGKSRFLFNYGIFCTHIFCSREKEMETKIPIITCNAASSCKKSLFHFFVSFAFRFRFVIFELTEACSSCARTDFVLGFAWTRKTETNRPPLLSLWHLLARVLRRFGDHFRLFLLSLRLKSLADDKHTERRSSIDRQRTTLLTGRYE